MSVVKMATVDCPHSNPLWFWLITQQAAIRYSIILLFLSNSIFLSRIWVCIKGSWNWTILLKCAWKINLTRWYSNAVWNFGQKAAQIVKQSSLFQANSVQLNSLNRAFPTPLVKIVPSEAEFYHEMSEHVCTRWTFSHIRYVFLRCLAFYSGTFRRWCQRTNGTNGTIGS